jgi:hypothetical protein
MLLSEELQKKWQPVLDHESQVPITDPLKRSVTATLLENQEQALLSGQAGEGRGLLSEAPLNVTGGADGTAGVGVDNYDPVLISLVRRAMPNLIAYDICGVQPMTGPTGLIFAMRATYANSTNRDVNTGAGTGGGGFGPGPNDNDGPAGAPPSEALYWEANTAFSGSGTHTGQAANVASSTTGTHMDTGTAEALTGGAFPQMGFVIDKVSVTAGSRALKAEYSIELAQDLKAIHGLDAETELANILSAEILSEINREVVRTVVVTAKAGGQQGLASAGIFNLDVDANGRWSVEKFKGLMFQIEREANKIAKDTRRGKGNIIICSADVASALSMTGSLDHAPALKDNLNVDDTGNTFAGVLNGRYKVYIDPYHNGGAVDTTLGHVDYAVVGYRGSSAYDAGLFYCPYVPLQMVRAVGENDFQPKIGFKTRYGLVNNPFATENGLGAVDATNPGTGDQNVYYRRLLITNLL